MDTLDKIKINHKNKSNQVKYLKKKLKYKSKNTVSIAHLKDLLAREKRYTIDPREYYFDGDDAAYLKDYTAKEARIKLLTALIQNIEDK